MRIPADQYLSSHQTQHLLPADDSPGRTPFNTYLFTWIAHILPAAAAASSDVSSPGVL